jgi:hypothetical protein
MFEATSAAILNLGVWAEAPSSAWIRKPVPYRFLSFAAALSFSMRSLLVLAVLCAVSFSASAQSIVINEVMSSNGETIADEDGDFPDWVELYNAGATPVDLTGFGISDDVDQAFRWSLPDTTLEAGAFLLVWASGKDRSEPGSLHLPFALSRDGDTVILSNATGEEVDRLDLPAIPRDVSYGRLPDGSSTWQFFELPTPGASNGGPAFGEVLDPPSFSHLAGLYTSPLDLTLEVSEPGIEIYYTLDGSEPSETSRRYTGSIHIRDRSGDPNNLSEIPTSATFHPWAPPMGKVFKGTVVRAAAFQDGAIASEIATATYFVDPGIQSRYTFPIISISSDSVGLFSGATGLLVPGDDYEEYLRSNPSGATSVERVIANYARRGTEWERPIHLEMIRDGETVLSHRAGMRIHGGLSRLYRQKGLRIYARNEYGQQYFPVEFFDEKPELETKRILLRHSGQDWTKTMVRDAFMQRLVRHLNVDYQAYEPAVIFINGEYWGIHNIRERIDRFYFEGNYGIDPERVDLLTANAQIKEGSNADYVAMRNFISSNDMRVQANFEWVEMQMDVDNFIDYTIANIFVRNNDWPHNNVDFWRYQTPYEPNASAGIDGRWRWILFDLDFGFGWSAARWDHDTVAWTMSADGNSHGSWATAIMRGLAQNQEFRNRFVSRFADQMNSTFRPAHVVSLIDEFETLLEPEIAEHIHRWGWRGDHSSFHQTPANIGEWRDNMETLREFARMRPGHVWSHILNNFQLGARLRLTIDVNDEHAGHVQVNTLHLRPQTVGVDAGTYPWQGFYFLNAPVQLTAHPSAGYRFAGWQGGDGSTSATMTMDLGGHTEVTAIFEPDEEWLAGAFPQPHSLSEGDYEFSEWHPTADAGSFPESMAFFFMDDMDPSLDAMPEGPTYGAYDLDSRTRIVGLGDAGVAFINTSNEDGNPGYPGRRLGAAVVALDTRDRTQIEVTWTGGTVVPNSRVYHMRLQYRIGDEGELNDLLDVNGDPVEYVRSDQAGHADIIGPIRLPDYLEGRPYVQLWWRYYHTGDRLDDDSGARDMIRLDDIRIESASSVSAVELPVELSTTLHPNYPNPFEASTTIRFEVQKAGHARVAVYDVLGRRIDVLVDEARPAGVHHVAWHSRDVASGVYFVRMEHGGIVQTRTVTKLK